MVIIEKEVSELKLVKLLRKIFRKKKLKIIDISTGKNVSKHVALEFHVDEEYKNNELI